MSIQINKAIAFAAEMHRGQKDKVGNDYILHPLAVWDIVREDGHNEDIQIVAILHDVVEDTPITEHDLCCLGYSKIIVDAILSVTRNEGEKYVDFIARAKQNEYGRIVKIADVKHNLTRSNGVIGFESLVKRYERALRLLNE